MSLNLDRQFHFLNTKVGGISNVQIKLDREAFWPFEEFDKLGR